MEIVTLLENRLILSLVIVINIALLVFATLKYST